MSRIETIADGVTLHLGDCLDVLAGMDACSADSCVTDPPYHLLSINKRFAKTGGADRKLPIKDHQYQRLSRGFMGKAWDGGDVAFRHETWAEVSRVLKPGAYLVAFGAPKNYHRLACTIEDAGFEIRDSLMWLFGSGFPKSHNQPGGWGTALKPAYEPIILARKPLIGTVAVNVLEHGTGAINIDGCRVEHETVNGGNLADNPHLRSDHKSHSHFMATEGGDRPGYVPSAQGRWPANVVHDGSPEVVAAFPEAPGQQRYVGPEHGDRPSKGIYGDFGARPPNHPRDDGGSAARFFYTAKADADDRLGSKHPTVKPVDLMQWLVRLTTRKGGIVLDPFAGTGTTGEAAFREGMRAALIERESEYQDDIRRRMKLVLAGPEERQRASIKAGGKTASAGPLFEVAP